jgi:hypothetical protein
LRFGVRRDAAVKSFGFAPFFFPPDGAAAGTSATEIFVEVVKHDFSGRGLREGSPFRVELGTRVKSHELGRFHVPIQISSKASGLSGDPRIGGLVKSRGFVDEWPGVGGGALFVELRNGVVFIGLRPPRDSEYGICQVLKGGVGGNFELRIEGV